MMKIELEDKLLYWEVKIKGRFTAAYTYQLAEILTQDLIAQKPYVLFDLSEMTHIDSTGLGELVRMKQTCLHQRGDVKLACIQTHPRIVFDITKVYRVFEIYDTLEMARDSFI